MEVLLVVVTFLTFSKVFLWWMLLLPREFLIVSMANLLNIHRFVASESFKCFPNLSYKQVRKRSPCTTGKFHLSAPIAKNKRTLLQVRCFRCGTYHKKNPSRRSNPEIQPLNSFCPWTFFQRHLCKRGLFCDWKLLRSGSMSLKI